ncbi:MAG: creatininase family protein [Actinomycetota bacterium]|nr:creatininase family protein [Actinomycetota bacterium]
MKMSRNFADLKSTDIGHRLSSSSILLVPVGAIEQHGPHLPLSVDLVIAETTVARIIAERGEELDLWALPPIAISKSNEHVGFAGSLSLRAGTLLALLDDLGSGIKETPIRKVVFVNGHGGNSSLLNVACRDLRVAHGLMTFLMHPFIPPDQGGHSPPNEMGMGIHGGYEETSVMLYLCPDLVDMNSALRNIPEELNKNRYVRFGGATSFGWLASDFGKHGHIGDPTGATSAAGQELFAAALEFVGDQLEEVSKFSFS